MKNVINYICNTKPERKTSMKKTLSIILCFVMVVSLAFTLVSCAKTLSGSYSTGGDALRTTYTFSGKKYTMEIKTNILGSINTETVTGTYEITENDDGTMEIAMTTTVNEEEKTSTYTFEEGEDYIKIGLVKYEKVKK